MKHLDHSRFVVAATLGCLALLLPGCASTSPDQDARFGEATRLLNAQQRLNPQASQANEGKTFKADGRTVKASQDRMVENYRQPPAQAEQNVGTIGSGSGSSTR